MTQFIEEKSRIMSLAAPNSAANLLAMKNSIERHLVSGQIVDFCDVEATGNQSCMLYATGVSRLTLDTVAAQLDYVFNENLRYGGDTTYQIECSEDTVVLDFATCGSANLLVTGCIAITCSA